MNSKKLISFKEKLHGSSEKFIIIPHKNPDGDAMGTSLGLAIYLQKLGHQVNIIAPTNFPDFFRWLPSADQVRVFSQEYTSEIKKTIDQADAIFLIDFNTLSRIQPLDVFLRCSRAFKVLIDHHPSPETFDLMFSNPLAPASAVLLFRLIKQMGDLNYINRDIAICLYTALVSDTDSFRFSSVNSETHIIAANLIEKGVNISEVQDRLYAVYSPKRIQLLTKVLKSMKILSQYKTAYMCVRSKDMKNYNYQKGDTEGFVNYGLNLKNVFLSVLFIEDRINQIIKISFRSKGGFDVDKLARTHFHGGGHFNAAGATSRESLKATLKRFLELLPLYKKKLL